MSIREGVKMNLFIARQPIFDRNDVVYGYELLYREESKNAYDESDGDMASSSVMITGFVSMGLEKLTGNKKAFVNFTEHLIKEGVATIFPKEFLVVEVLETIEPTKEVIEACKKLKNAGYTIALDDFVYKPGFEKLVELADIIKVDFLLSSEEERSELFRRFGKGKTKFLAEKVETLEAYKKAYNQGYSYFQGYYFSKPTTVTANIIPPNKMNYLQLISEINSEEINFDNLGNIIERDVAFSYEMLKLANSAMYYPVSRIKSIRQAITFLGEEGLKKWVYISVLRKIGNFKDNELVDISMIRSKVLEQICDILRLNRRKSEFMTLGMISMLDVLLGIPIDVILEQVAVSDEIRASLFNENNQDIMSKCFKLILAYEKGNWVEVTRISKEVGIKTAYIAEMYYQSVLWIQKLKKC